MATQTTTQASAGQTSTRKSVGHYVPAVARILMGLLFTATGLMGLIFTMEVADASTPDMVFSAALAHTGYMTQLVSGTQLIVGLLLLSNRFVPLALALIAPVVVNIFALHLFLAPAGLPLAVIVVALELYLAWSYRKAFRPMLAARNAR